MGQADVLVHVLVVVVDRAVGGGGPDHLRHRVGDGAELGLAFAQLARDAAALDRLPAAVGHALEQLDLELAPVARFGLVHRHAGHEAPFLEQRDADRGAHAQAPVGVARGGRAVIGQGVDDHERQAFARQAQEIGTEVAAVVAPHDVRRTMQVIAGQVDSAAVILHLAVHAAIDVEVATGEGGGRHRDVGRIGQWAQLVVELREEAVPFDSLV
jgi:hypothetical protein